MDRSLLAVLGNFVLMSYLPLKLEICYFLSFSMVKFRFLIEIRIEIIILSCLPEQFASKSI